MALAFAPVTDLFTKSKILCDKLSSSLVFPSKMSETPFPLCPCNTCGRSFHPDVIERHSNVCQKSIKSSQKRKTFDSTKMRARDTELEKLQNEQKYMPNHLKPEKPKLPVKKANWRAKHDDFIKTIRAARGEDTVPSQMQKEATPYVNPDYVQCQYCSRHFNEGAAERHIPFCKDKQNRIQQKGPDKAGDASDRMSKRTQYKAPLPKSAQKKMPVPRTKDAKTRSLHEGMESNHSSIPMPNSNRNKQFIRHDTSGGGGGDLSSTRDLSKDKRPPIVKKDFHKPSLHSRGSEANSNNSHQDVNIRERSVEKRRDRRTFNRNDGGINQITSDIPISTSDSSQSMYSNNLPYNFPSQLPSLRKKSHSASSLGSNESNGSSHRDVPLNEYGTPMAKFCYECGGRYPVPQAKFCCMCGTQRI